MRGFVTGYADGFNSRHKRVGHLFQMNSAPKEEPRDEGERRPVRFRRRRNRAIGMKDPFLGA